MNMINNDEFKLIGLKLGKKTMNEGGQAGIDCGMLWQRFVTENISGKIPDRTGDEVYAVYFDYDGDHTKPYSFFIGCKVKMNAEVPQGLDSLFIPAGKYAKIIAKGAMPDCIANAWKEIWESNIDRAYSYDFEMYDERAKDWSNAEVDIFIASNDKPVG